MLLLQKPVVYRSLFLLSFFKSHQHLKKKRSCFNPGTRTWSQPVSAADGPQQTSAYLAKKSTRRCWTEQGDDIKVLYALKGSSINSTMALRGGVQRFFVHSISFCTKKWWWVKVSKIIKNSPDVIYGRPLISTQQELPPKGRKTSF